jgi:hypothetical protein
MTKKTFLGAMAVVTAVALTGSALVASNMGFKLNYTLLQGGGGVSADGTSVLALPDNRQTGLNDAKALMDDIGFTNTFSVAKHIKATNAFQTYTGRKGTGPVFALASGEGYYVRMQTSTNYVVVGSDDPAITYPLTQGGGGVSADGTNFFAYNYHQTAADAKALMDDIGFANTFSVAKHIKATNAFQTYTGRKGTGAVFPLVPGEAYYVRMQTTVNYAPSHY